MSIPNRDLQEYLSLERYVQQHQKIKGVIVPLVFDGLRDETIRNNVVSLIDRAEHMLGFETPVSFFES